MIFTVANRSFFLRVRTAPTSYRATEGIVGSRFEECQGNPRSSGPENREQMGTVSLPGNSKSPLKWSKLQGYGAIVCHHG